MAGAVAMYCCIFFLYVFLKPLFRRRMPAPRDHPLRPQEDIMFLGSYPASLVSLSKACSLSLPPPARLFVPVRARAIYVECVCFVLWRVPRLALPCVGKHRFKRLIRQVGRSAEAADVHDQGGAVLKIEIHTYVDALCYVWVGKACIV